MLNSVTEVFNIVLKDGIIGIVLSFFIVLISYIKLKNRLIYKIIILMLIFVEYCADATVLITSVQILMPNNYNLVTIIVIGLGIVILGSVSYIFMKQVIIPLNQLTIDAKEIATGNIGIKIVETSRGDEIGNLQNSFHLMTNFLKPLVNNISSATKILTEAATKLASSSEEVNASSEEFASISQQISEGSQKQSNNLHLSLEQIEITKKEFIEKINNIKMASDLIENISSQVNMLALNASIEAARAGEYGRGFSVVADNIQRLSDNVKASTNRVNEIILDLSNSIDSNMNLLNNGIVNVTSVAEETSASAEESSIASQEQSATIQELTASAQDLSKIANDLDYIVKRFKL